MTNGEVVRVNGVDLFVRRFGDPVLVVVHGGPTWDHTYLLPAVAELADVAHVVVFDLRGCGRSCRTPPVGALPLSALQPDYVADDVAALVRHVGAEKADVLGFSYGGMVAMRVVDQHPDVVRSVILASTTAYRDFHDELAASVDYQERRALCTEIGFDDLMLTGPDAPDGALSRAMAFAGAPQSIWRLDRLDQWRQVLEGMCFTNDWNEPYASGTLRPGAPEDAARVLREWGRPVLLEVPDAAHMAHFDNPSVWLSHPQHRYGARTFPVDRLGRVARRGCARKHGSFASFSAARPR